MLMLALMAMAIWMIQGTIATSNVVYNITTSAKSTIFRDTKVNSDSAIAEARLRLKGKLASNSSFAGDPTATTWDYQQSSPNVNWSAYLLSYAPWQFSKDPDYRVGDTNYFPTSSSLMNTAITVNSVQQALPYWIKMRHKREYDAEQLGHRTTSPHYTDNDGGTALHPLASPGSVLYYGYLSSTSTTPVEFTTSIPTNWPQVELITIHTESNGTVQRIQAEVARDVGPPIPAALYSKGNINFMVAGSSSVNGDDGYSGAGNTCGRTPNRPPLYILDPGTMSGSAAYLGTPASPMIGTVGIDIAQYILKYKTGATIVDSDQAIVSYGSSSNYVTVYSNTSLPLNVGGLKLSDVTGYGLLLVDGDLILEKNVSWYGLILVTGTLTLNSASTASGETVYVRGGVLAGNIVGVKDQFLISYNSCYIAKAMATKPTKLLTWRRL